MQPIVIVYIPVMSVALAHKRQAARTLVDVEKDARPTECDNVNDDAHIPINWAREN